MKKLQIPQKHVQEKFYVHEKILPTKKCVRKFIKNLLTEKGKENMETKQPRFESRRNHKHQLHMLANRNRRNRNLILSV